MSLELRDDLIWTSVDYKLIKGFSTLGELYDTRFDHIQSDLSPSAIYASEENYRQYVNQVTDLKRTIDQINDKIGKITLGLTRELDEQINTEISLIQKVTVDLAEFLPLSDLDSPGVQATKIDRIIAPLFDEVNAITLPAALSNQLSISLIVDQLERIINQKD